MADETDTGRRSGRARRALDLLWPRETPEPEPARKVDDLDDFLRDAMERANDAYAKVRDNIGEAYEDLEFRAGDHWPTDARQRREKQRRPILTINDVPQFVRQITGDIRLMKPSIKAIPIDARATEGTAKILSGMIRYIEARSHAKVAYALAADSQVACGVGHWRVTTEYAQETTFNQEIRIVHIEDGVSVLWDPDSILPTREDATWCLVPVDQRRGRCRADRRRHVGRDEGLLMPTTTPNPPPLPHIEVPLVDPATGRLTPEWYKWLAFWDRVWRQLRKEIP